jgi:hypothetical protein
MGAPSPCAVCGKPVEPDSCGRARRFHAECRKEGRSVMMQGNQRRRGKLTTGGIYKAFPADPMKTEAYQDLDPTAIRRVGVAYWGELADFAYWCFDVLNPLCFGGRIPHPLFQFPRVTPYGKCLGWAEVCDLDRPVINIFLSTWTRRRDRHASVFPLISHEMMHFDVTMRWRDAGQCRYRTSHDNEFWLDGVQAAAPPLGVDLALMKHPFCQWPHGGWSKARRKKAEALLAGRRWE